MADRQIKRSKRIMRLQVHRFLYRTWCDSCGQVSTAGELVPIGMRDCPERDEFIDSFRTGTAKYLGAGGGSLCDQCQLENIIGDAVDDAADLLGLDLDGPFPGLDPTDDDER